jgi:hypothetical protein
VINEPQSVKRHARGLREAAPPQFAKRVMIHGIRVTGEKGSAALSRPLRLCISIGWT